MTNDSTLRERIERLCEEWENYESSHRSAMYVRQLRALISEKPPSIFARVGRLHATSGKFLVVAENERSIFVVSAHAADGGFNQEELATALCAAWNAQIDREQAGARACEHEQIDRRLLSGQVSAGYQWCEKCGALRFAANEWLLPQLPIREIRGDRE